MHGFSPLLSYAAARVLPTVQTPHQAPQQLTNGTRAPSSGLQLAFKAGPQYSPAPPPFTHKQQHQQQQQQQQQVQQ